MKLPIIINESGDITLYTSVADAEINLEPIDVKDCIYSGYDAEGRLLKIELIGNKVSIKIAESKPSQKRELEELLRRALTIVGRNINEIELGDLNSLIEKSSIFLFFPPKSNMEIAKNFLKDLFTKNKAP